MIWPCIIFSILLSTFADPQPTEQIIKEAQQKIMVFLKEPAGVTWLTTLTQRQKSPLRTSELLTAILEKTCPAGPETKSAASKLQELLTTENSTRIEFEGWKDLIDSGPQNDVICIYRALNSTLNHTEDWQKFLTSFSEGYMVYLALDMGTKFIICLKKVPEIPTTTPGPKMANGSRALNENLPLNEESCEETTEKNTRRQFADIRPAPTPPPCNRPIVYVFPLNYPVQAVNWYPNPHGFFYRGPDESQKFGTYQIFGPYAPQNNFQPPKVQSQEYSGTNLGPVPYSYGSYKNFLPRPTFRPTLEPDRTTKTVRPFITVLPIRRSPFFPEQIGPKCDKNSWRPECFWKPTENRNQAPVRPTMIDNNFGYRKTLPVKEPPKDLGLNRFWKKNPFDFVNWGHKAPEQAPLPVPPPLSTAPVPWIVYNKYSVKYPTTGFNLGPTWSPRAQPVPLPLPGPVPGPVPFPGPVPGPIEPVPEHPHGKGCNNLCNLCDRPIVVKVLMDNSGKKAPGDLRRSISPQLIAEAISQTDKSLEEVEKKIREIEGAQSDESDIEESTESSEG